MRPLFAESIKIYNKNVQLNLRIENEMDQTRYRIIETVRLRTKHRVVQNHGRFCLIVIWYYVISSGHLGVEKAFKGGFF